MTETLSKYWVALDAKQRRLIWDLLRVYSSTRRGLPMGLLPFVPIKEVIRVLEAAHPSPWTDHLHQEYLDRMAETERWWNEGDRMKFKLSSEHDKKDYRAIINILTPPHPPALKAQLEKWLKKQEEKSNDD